MNKTDGFELAAALLALLGEPVPHSENAVAPAEELLRRRSDARRAVLDAVRVCGTPKTPREFYLCTKLYGRLGRQYDAKTAESAAAYLASPGWEELPRGKEEVRGVSVDLSVRNRAGIFADLGTARAGLGDDAGACSAYGKAYALEPFRVGYAVQLADALARSGRVGEALEFLTEQKKSPYYPAARYRGVTGEIRRDSSFRDMLDARIEEMKKRLNRLERAAPNESRSK